jgi:hypothetical protein
LGELLTTHVAGGAVPEEKSALFRRATDLRLRALNHGPLEVGADRIALAAAEALKLQQDLREARG